MHAAFFDHLIDGVCDKEDDEYHRTDMQKMLDSNFDGLKRLEREGQIRLVLEIENRVDEDGWRRCEERRRGEEIQRLKWAKEKEERKDSGLDSSDEEDKTEGEEEEGFEEDEE